MVNVLDCKSKNKGSSPFPDFLMFYFPVAKWYSVRLINERQRFDSFQENKKIKCMWQNGYCGDLLNRGLYRLAGSNPVILFYFLG